MKRFIYFLLAAAILSPWCLETAAEATFVTPLDLLELTGGSVHNGGRFDRVLDRLLEQGGVLKMGEYQPIGDIVPSITKGHTTYSLFTSGLNGGPAPSASVNGSSITADLSSLFFAVSRGDSFRLWNIGGVATGTFNPTTSQFNLSWKDRIPSAFETSHSEFRPSWDHFFKDKWDSDGRNKSNRSHREYDKGAWDWKNGSLHRYSEKAAFLLEGRAVTGPPPAAVPIPATVVLYASGLLGLGSWVWFTRLRRSSGASFLTQI